MSILDHLIAITPFLLVVAALWWFGHCKANHWKKQFSSATTIARDYERQLTAINSQLRAKEGLIRDYHSQSERDGVELQLLRHEILSPLKYRGMYEAVLKGLWGSPILDRNPQDILNLFAMLKDQLQDAERTSAGISKMALKYSGAVRESGQKAARLEEEIGLLNQVAAELRETNEAMSEAIATMLAREFVPVLDNVSGAIRVWNFRTKELIATGGTFKDAIAQAVAATTGEKFATR